MENVKDLCDSIESKYIVEDASGKKFLVSDFDNYKMVDSRPVTKQYNELLHILGQFTLHKINLDECIVVSSVIDFKHTLTLKRRVFFSTTRESHTD